MTLDLSKIKFTSTNDTFKNSLIVNVPLAFVAHTFADGTAQVITNTISITRGQTISQIKINLSYDSAKWHIVPLFRFSLAQPSASVQHQLYANYTDSLLKLVSVFTPIGISPWSYPAFTATANVKLFITPSV